MLVTVVAVIAIAAVLALVPGMIAVVPMVRTAVATVARSDGRMRILIRPRFPASLCAAAVARGTGFSEENERD